MLSYPWFLGSTNQTYIYSLFNIILTTRVKVKGMLEGILSSKSPFTNSKMTTSTVTSSYLALLWACCAIVTRDDFGFFWNEFRGKCWNKMAIKQWYFSVGPEHVLKHGFSSNYEFFSGLLMFVYLH